MPDASVLRMKNNKRENVGGVDVVREEQAEDSCGLESV